MSPADEHVAALEWREALLNAACSMSIIARILASITCIADLLGPPESSMPAADGSTIRDEALAGPPCRRPSVKTPPTK
jgi:hypothetical protein